ncbi:hypothetical protein OsJ_06855 [Oryza sativa Japonica Group]|uniref:Uncharacterized protein n=2 Tax=Oryza TaxID=4527 RepID=A3A782_ORYSJ|nr:hypothetical protein OsJ_06855 [Oryza sativa Japonica Group]
MWAASSSSSMQHLFLLCRLLGFCFVFTASQQQQSDSCSSAGVAVAHLAFRCLTVWKQEDFVLRVCMLLNFAVLPVIGILLRTNFISVNFFILDVIANARL